jgi:glycosyltransferase involved in cell wall biosynthesis
MPEVGIIMRTRDRPATLPRALRSVVGQAFADWQLAIVNDGGDREALEALAGEELAGRRDQAIFLHHETSRGRWPAANAGVAALDCRFLVIHDDDDSWHPHFLARTVAEMGSADEGIGGVATRMIEVVERIVDGKPVAERQRPINPDLKAITIAEMARNNLITPISFLYRRAVHERVGMYDETLPVLGDWEFYLRLLRHYDIRLIDEPLAYYHKRSGTGAYGNTVIGGVSQHHETEARIRNRLLRQDLDAGIIGMGTLLALGRQSRYVDELLASIRRRIASYAQPWQLFAKKKP